MILSKVLLPEPFRPINPSVWPFGISSEMFLTASKSWYVVLCRKNLEKRARTESGRSWMTRKRCVTFSTRIIVESVGIQRLRRKRRNYFDIYETADTPETGK